MLLGWYVLIFTKIGCNCESDAWRTKTVQIKPKINHSIQNNSLRIDLGHWDRIGWDGFFSRSWWGTSTCWYSSAFSAVTLLIPSKIKHLRGAALHYCVSVIKNSGLSQNFWFADMRIVGLWVGLQLWLRKVEKKFHHLRNRARVEKYKSTKQRGVSVMKQGQ